MAGTGGFRKFRFAREGMGKSGGARVVYVYNYERYPVFLITVFPKNKKANLTKAERNALNKRADTIFTNYRMIMTVPRRGSRLVRRLAGRNVDGGRNSITRAPLGEVSAAKAKAADEQT